MLVATCLDFNVTSSKRLAQFKAQLKAFGLARPANGEMHAKSEKLVRYTRCKLDGNTLPGCINLDRRSCSSIQTHHLRSVCSETTWQRNAQLKQSYFLELQLGLKQQLRLAFWSHPRAADRAYVIRLCTLRNFDFTRASFKMDLAKVLELGCVRIFGHFGSPLFVCAIFPVVLLAMPAHMLRRARTVADAIFNVCSVSSNS